MKSLQRTVKPEDRYYDKLADQLLEEWARQNNAPDYANLGGGSTSLNGNMAITRTDKYKAKSGRRIKDSAIEGDDSFWIDGYPANGKESDPGSNQIPRRLIADYNRMARIMSSIEANGPDGPLHVMVLTHYYTCRSIDLVAIKMRMGTTKVKALRKAAKQQVVLLLRESWGD